MNVYVSERIFQVKKALYGSTADYSQGSSVHTTAGSPSSKQTSSLTSTIMAASGVASSRTTSASAARRTSQEKVHGKS